MQLHLTTGDGPTMSSPIEAKSSRPLALIGASIVMTTWGLVLIGLALWLNFSILASTGASLACFVYGVCYLGFAYSIVSEFKAARLGGGFDLAFPAWRTGHRIDRLDNDAQ